MVTYRAIEKVVTARYIRISPVFVIHEVLTVGRRPSFPYSLPIALSAIIKVSIIEKRGDAHICKTSRQFSDGEDMAL